MIQTLRAFAWLRWRLLVNSLRRPRRRDALEHASRVVQIVLPVLLFLLFLPGALAVGGLGLVGGFLLGTTEGGHEAILAIIRILLFVGLMVTLLTPLLRALQGSTAHLSRFLILPVPRGSLYLFESLAGLVDPWVLLLVPGLLLLPLGLIVSERWGAAAISLVAGLAVIAILVGAGNLLSSLAHLVFRDRRRGEMVSVVLFTLIFVAGFLPGMFTQLDRKEMTPTEPKRERSRSAESWTRDPGMRSAGPPPLWSNFYPPELYVRALSSGVHGRGSESWFPLLVLSAMAVSLQVLGVKVHRRLLETPATASGRRGGAGGRLRGIRIPGVSGAVSMVALTHLRVTYRTVQGKIAFWMTPLMVVALGTLFLRTGGVSLPEWFPLTPGILLAFLGVFFSFLTLEGANLNQFANDRAGLTLAFLTPLSERELIRGKALGGALLVVNRSLLSILIAVVMAPAGPLFIWLSVPVVGITLFMLLAPVGAVLSAVFPKTARGENRLGASDKPHSAASLLGFLTLAAAAAPAVLGLLLGLLFFRSAALAFLLVSVWAMLAGLVSIPIYRMAERLVAQRRENLALVAQGR